MHALRWAAIIVFLVCLAVAAAGARDWFIAFIGFAAFLTAAWTFRSSGRPTRPVSHWFDEAVEDPTGALSRLDRLDGRRNPQAPDAGDRQRWDRPQAAGPHGESASGPHPQSHTL